VEAIRRGRREEFAAFQWQGEPPDPQNEAAFLDSKLNWQLRSDSQHRILVEFYRELIRLRRKIPALACLSKDSLEIKGFAQRKLLLLHRWNKDSEVVAVFNINKDRTSVRLPIPAGRWRKGLDSSEERWRGIGSTTPEQISSNGEADFVLNPWSLVLFVKET
jgi:maltooligosyltrehalose trehalohydrolase